MKLGVLFNGRNGPIGPVLVNGKWLFHFDRMIDDVALYMSPDIDYVSIDTFFCIEPVGGEGTNTSLPRSMYVTFGIHPQYELRFVEPVFNLNNRGLRRKGAKEFRRRLDRFYVPDFWKDGSLTQIENFFNYLAPRYDQVITPALNVAAWCKLAEYATFPFPRDACAMNVLDFGVGTGYVLELAINELSGATHHHQVPCRLYGTDLSEAMLQTCRRDRSALFYEGPNSLRKCSYEEQGIPYPANFFDAVIACYVVHYFIDNTPLKAIRRVLKPGGVLAMNLHETNGVKNEQLMVWLAQLAFEPIDIKCELVSVGGESKPLTMFFARRPFEEQSNIPEQYSLWE